jgi:hypothetical protein
LQGLTPFRIAAFDRLHFADVPVKFDVRLQIDGCVAPALREMLWLSTRLPERARDIELAGKSAESARRALFRFSEEALTP